MSSDKGPGPMRPTPWTRRHLLGLEDLAREELLAILDTAEQFVQPMAGKRSHLAGKVMVNLFFEPSTRTRISFGLAARRLSADVIDFTGASSSLSKGETFIDTPRRGRRTFWRSIYPAASSTPATAPTNIRPRACSTFLRSAGSKRGWKG